MSVLTTRTGEVSQLLPGWGFIYIYITDFLAFAWRLVLQIVGFEKLRA